jgi:predicted CDP-diglyceride synthetase/phosphatidate cytidylyltransferase
MVVLVIIIYNIMSLFANFGTIVFFGIVAFLILREFMAWYWKTNKIIELLEDIKKNTSVKNDSTTKSNNNVKLP